MNRETWRLLRKKMPKNNQKGFTLIELLVVISILGILAAVVTMSVIGITNQARNRAGATELSVVQTAMDTMLADQGVDSTNAAACGSAPSTALTAISDMTAFPSNLAWSAVPTHAVVSLYPHYLRENATHGKYYCINLGEIQQLQPYAP